MDDDEAVSNFCAITSASVDTAKQYLQVNDNNLEAAIELFFSTGGASLDGGAAGGSSASGGGGGDDADNDAAVAAAAMAGFSDDEVRERIAPVTERLVDPTEMAIAGGGMFSAGRQGIFNQRAPPQPRQRGAFDDSDGERDNDDDEDDDDDDVYNVHETVGSSNLTRHQTMLARLFRPPFDIISEIDLDTAKSKAHKQEKWVMVNIQESSEFLCQQLNRDLWSDKRVKDTVKQNFVFLQYDKNSAAGEEYRTMYPFEEMPHISMLDPRTGEQMKVWNGVVPPVDKFLEEVFAFLAKFSLKKGAKNPTVSLPVRRKKVEHMTEDEQIEMAMRESMGLSTHNEEDAHGEPQAAERDSTIKGTRDEPVEFDDDDEEMEELSDDEVVWDSSIKGKQKQSVPLEVPEVPESAAAVEEDSAEDRFYAIEPVNVPEPTDAAVTTRIQFRYSGGRVIKKFNVSDSVRTLFAAIKHDVKEVEGHFFSLTTQPPDRKKLIDHLDETVESANLKNSVVMIEIEE